MKPSTVRPEDVLQSECGPETQAGAVEATSFQNHPVLEPRQHCQNSGADKPVDLEFRTSLPRKVRR